MNRPEMTSSLSGHLQQAAWSSANHRSLQQLQHSLSLHDIEAGTKNLYRPVLLSAINNTNKDPATTIAFRQTYTVVWSSIAYFFVNDSTQIFQLYQRTRIVHQPLSINVHMNCIFAVSSYNSEIFDDEFITGLSTTELFLNTRIYKK